MDKSHTLLTVENLKFNKAINVQSAGEREVGSEKSIGTLDPNLPIKMGTDYDREPAVESAPHLTLTTNIYRRSKKK